MIVCLDFQSLYPSMMIGGNLYSPANIKKGEDYWQGGGIYTSIFQNTHEGIRGKYSRHQGIIEKTIESLFRKRLTVKDNPSQYLATKILINTIYGILGSSEFSSIYNIITASDVTAMARRSIFHARTVLESYGYEVLYTDTDSAFVIVKDNDLERLKYIAQYITDEQKKSFNVPFELHNLKIDAIIKRMYFFRDDKGNFIKKHYIYVTNKDEVIIKGLSIKQGNTSKISKLFFKDVIEDNIKTGKFKYYNVESLKDELVKYIKGKEELLQKRFRVKKPKFYKIPEGKDEPTGQSYQVAKKYGEGEHWLIANKRIGIGKGEGMKYAKMEELKHKYGDRWKNQLRLEPYLKELSEFINYKDRGQISRVDRMRTK